MTSQNDEKRDTKEDVLSLLPDSCNSSSNEGAFRESSFFAPTTSCQTVEEENSDFGGYHPSCLSISAPEDAAQQRHLTNFFSSLKSLDLKEEKKEKGEKKDPPCILADGLLDQDIIQREGGDTLEVQTASKENSGQIHDLCLEAEQKWSSRFLEEKKNLEAERETVLYMKEQISQADATLRKQLHEHALRMQTETEEMARQKRELEYAKNIAAEIALEVDNSRRELQMYKSTINKTIPEAQGKVPHTEVSLTAHLAAKRLPNYERYLEPSRKVHAVVGCTQHRVTPVQR